MCIRDRPSAHNTGYIRINVNGQQYAAHRIVWALANNKLPSTDNYVDHINGIKTDNRISNLRLVTPSGNNRNSKRQSCPVNTHVGLYFRIDRQKWRASININGEKIWLGTFESKEDAIAARKKAEEGYDFYSSEGLDGNIS